MPGRSGRALSEERDRQLHSFEVLFVVDSTNTRLLGLPAPPAGCADVCMSELQHSGRGRRGRRWIASFGDSIALSLAWTFGDAARASPALSLATGVAISRALAKAGARGIGLKWPNDIWFDDRKLGGVLIELRADAGGPAHVVIGVGLNASLSMGLRRMVEASGVRVSAVAEASSEKISRNRMAGLLLEELLSMLGQFETEGFAPFRDAWRLSMCSAVGRRRFWSATARCRERRAVSMRTARYCSKAVAGYTGSCPAR